MKTKMTSKASLETGKSTGFLMCNIVTQSVIFADFEWG